MAKLWKKTDQKTDSAVEKYTAGTDYVFDMELLPFDIAASRAHAKGLSKIGILTDEEFTKVKNGLAALEKDVADGKISITPEMEDCHTVIENYLTETEGDVGKKIHTGRSRNDQVQTAVRLYMKHHLGLLRASTAGLAGQFLDLAEKYAGMPMPGYSHTQQAMLSSVGHYFAAYVESLLDDADHLLQVAEQLDKSPLGSAAGFGTSIPVDREFTAVKWASPVYRSILCTARIRGANSRADTWKRSHKSCSPSADSPTTWFFSPRRNSISSRSTSRLRPAPVSCRTSTIST